MGSGGQRGEAGARACGLSAARAEAGLALSAGRSWAVREGRWASGVKGWAVVESGPRGEGERKEVGLMGFLGRAGFWLVFLF